MAIATAVKRGSVVYVYDEKNRLLLSITAGHKPEDGLVGYTSTTVSVRRGGVCTPTTRRTDSSVRIRHDSRQRWTAGVVHRRSPPCGRRARDPWLYTGHDALGPSATSMGCLA